MGTLEVNFHGPIAFRLCKHVAWAYLPLCENHRCNILTDVNDLSPYKFQVYAIKGPTEGETQVAKEPAVVKWKWAWGDGPKPGECYCIFRLPSPDVICGLRAEWAEISTSDGPIFEGAEYARGIRFHYKHCDKEPMISSVGGKSKSDFTDFTAKYYGHGDNYQVEIRFHDIKYQSTLDHHHRDAMKCSRKMRRLFPPLDKWKVNFEKPKHQPSDPHPVDRSGGGTVQHGGPHPVDCGANVIVLTDGITI
jgi:hypothetical protein